ncbi:hypothetical protein V8E51_002636 [Hyaloscypha variabilis]
MAYLRPDNGYDIQRYPEPQDLQEISICGRVTFYTEEDEEHLGQNEEETYQVRYLLDLLCRVWKADNDGSGAWTHEDIKIMMETQPPYIIWWSNRRSADAQLREIQRGLHWVNPRRNRSRRRYLRFTDTDDNNWSRIAENLIEMCLAGRI